MPDKAGDRFTDRKGRTYELRPDPKGGHLRPYTIGGKNPILTGMVMMAAAAVVHIAYEGLRWMWDKIARRKK